MQIIHDEKDDFRSKMKKFGAKSMQQNKKIHSHRVRNKLLKSTVSPYASQSTHYNPISVNIKSIKSKIKFARLVCYSTNCLANISDNKFNCDTIVEKGGIETMKQVIRYHNSNPAIMKEVSHIITNIAKTNAIHTENICGAGLLKQCINTLHMYPNETGIFAIDIMHSVLKYTRNPKTIAQKIIENNGIKTLQHVLNESSNNPDLCASVISFMNALMTADPSITLLLADKSIWSSIMNCMKSHPQHADLSIVATQALTKLASSSPNNSTAIHKFGGVGIISKCMQHNPDSKELIRYGADALALLANENDVKQSLMVLLDFDKHNDIIISQALGLLANLSLIEENAQFIQEKGGLECLINLINYKCKKQDLSGDEIVVVENGIRAMGRLLNNDKNIQLFVHKGGVKLLTDIMTDYDKKENIMNAVVDAFSNLGQELIRPELAKILTEITCLICKRPQYTVLMQKYSDILCGLSLNDTEILNNLLNAGLLQGIQQSLATNCNDSETMISIMNLIKKIVLTNPKLAHEIINKNANGIIKAMETSVNCPVLLQKILDTVYVIGKADPNLLTHLNKRGFNDTLLKILKRQTICDETITAVKTFVDSIESANIEYDLSELKEIGIGLNEITKYTQETEVKYDSSEVLHDTVECAPIAVNISPIIEQKQIDSSAVDACPDSEPLATYDTQTIMTKLKKSKDVKLIFGTTKEIIKRLKGGDKEIFNEIVYNGGLGFLLSKTNANIGNTSILNGTLDAVCMLSKDTQLKQLLGMHGVIRLILEVMRIHSNDIEVLDKCCYILSNLSFNNEDNMTAIVELGGVVDIVDVIMTHDAVNFLCESAINVLVNLCHNSDTNKVLIARSRGAIAAINALKLHNRCRNDGDEALVLACFKCLGNLAYVNENVKQLISLDMIAYVFDAMNQNTDKKDLIQMGVVVLANLSSHEDTSLCMVRLGVLDLIIKVSHSYSNEMEIQRSCLGCIGNLMNEQSNVVEFIDKQGHLRVFDIMQELVFEESVVMTALKLLKILATDTAVATELCIDGGCKVVAQIMQENMGNSHILSLGCQAICKMIVTMEAAKHIQNDGLCEIIIDIAKDDNNWANIQIMNELVKIIVNVSCIERNALLLARHGSVALLRSVEAHKTNAIFLNNAAMALAKICAYPSSSKILIKSGVIAVVLTSMQANPTRKAILARYVRALTNLLYTEQSAMAELVKHNGYKIVQHLASKHLYYEPLQREMITFKKAARYPRHYTSHIQTHTHTHGHTHTHKHKQSIRDYLHASVVTFLCQGTLIKKYGNNGKGKKKILKMNEDCSLLLFEDPNGKKTSKQLNMRSATSVVEGLKDNKNAFVIIAIDPNGTEFRIVLECKTNTETKKWVGGLQNIIQIIASNNNNHQQ